MSLAFSADAKTLMVGASGVGGSGKTGYVKIYRINGNDGNMVQLGQTIYGGKDNDYFGQSIDISSDGNTLFIGAPGNDVPGYVRILSLDSSVDLGTGTWKQIGQDIIGEGFDDSFGKSVSASGDGKTIAAGAPYNSNGNGDYSGHVRIYRLNDDGMSWEQIGQNIDGEAAGHQLGHSVSLSADGRTVAIAAEKADNNGVMTGQVRVYRISSAGSSWEQLGQSMYGDNFFDYFGRSVTISSDGFTLAIGASANNPGYLRVFSLESNNNLGTNTWNQIGQDIIGRANGIGFGESLSLSEDAKTLAVGAPYPTGYVRVYQMNDFKSRWDQIGEDIDGEVVGDESGISVSLSADGKTVAIGSMDGGNENGIDTGHVRVFVLEKR